MGLLHFVMDLCYPPYLVNHIEKATNIGMFLLPCVVFFVVFESGCNIEQHLVRLNKFYEDDVSWAKAQLNGVECYSEFEVRMSAARVHETLDEMKGSGPNASELQLDDILDETLKHASTHRGTSFDDQAQVVPGAGRTTNLFRGLWPGPILLASRLSDDDSKSFKLSMRAFMSIFAFMHVLIIWCLAVAAFREIGDTLANQRPQPGSLHVAGAHYQNLGAGYCRDDSLQRPDCYWMEWKKGLADTTTLVNSPARNTKKQRHQANRLVAEPLFGPRKTGKAAVFLSVLSNKSSSQSMDGEKWLPSWIEGQVTGENQWPEGYVDTCAKHCSTSDPCVGFSVDEDFCTIYNSKHTKEPAGWSHAAEMETRTSSVRRTAHIIQTNKYELSTCWSKDKLQAEPQDMAGALVCILHVFVVLFILGSSIRYIK